MEEITVRVLDLPQVQEIVRERDQLRSNLRASVAQFDRLQFRTQSVEGRLEAAIAVLRYYTPGYSRARR